MMTIRLPSGTGESVARGYEALRPKERVHYLSYVVTRRERMSTIAARYHLPMREVQSANPRVQTSHLKAGTRLVIPAVAVPSALAMKATGTIGGGRGHSRAHLHRVRRGETLTAIARRYRVSVRSIRRVNALASEHAIRAGMRLRIPG
jgi:LysM repeat protein